MRAAEAHPLPPSHARCRRQIIVPAAIMATVLWSREGLRSAEGHTREVVANAAVAAGCTALVAAKAAAVEGASRAAFALDALSGPGCAQKMVARRLAAERGWRRGRARGRGRDAVGARGGRGAAVAVRVPVRARRERGCAAPHECPRAVHRAPRGCGGGGGGSSPCTLQGAGGLHVLDVPCTRAVSPGTAPVRARRAE